MALEMPHKKIRQGLLREYVLEVMGKWNSSNKRIFGMFLNQKKSQGNPDSADSMMTIEIMGKEFQRHKIHNIIVSCFASFPRAQERNLKLFNTGFLKVTKQKFLSYKFVGSFIVLVTNLINSLLWFV